MRNLHWMAAGLVLSGVVLPAADQIPQPAATVKTTVTVEARHGKEVPVMKSGDIMVFQKDQRMRVTDVDARAGLELYILIDEASGLSLGNQLNDLKQFIETQPADTSLGVGYMRNGTVLFTQALTTDHAAAAKSLRLPLGYPGAMPSPFLSVSDLIKRWPASRARREILLVSSGIDPLGGRIADPYLETAIEDAQRAGVIVYAIYAPAGGHAGHSFWQIQWGQNHLAQIAEETGGESYMLGFGPLVAFAPYLAELSEHLAHQYVVTFAIPLGKKAGLQPVRFATEAPNAELVSASKVYFPAQH